MPSKTETGTLGGAYNTVPAAIAIYALGAFLTFGHIFNLNYTEATPIVECGDVPEIVTPAWNSYWSCRQGNIDAKYSGTSRFDAGFPAFYAAVAWPIYWGGHFAIKVTK